MKKYLFLILLLCLPVHDATLSAQQKAFTLEQVMSAAFPSDLVAAPQGNKVAWALDARGVRNVWVAESPEYKGHAVTSYREDDGQEIAELCWTPDARFIVYVRGGDFENDGDNPNPRSYPEGVEQAIWIVPAAVGAEPRKLAEGHSPTVSPNGDYFAYINKKQIWTMKLDGSEKPKQLINAHGTSSSLRWSPDGKRLAFVSERGNHSFIGVYDTSTKSLRYMSPSVDRDNELVWSPDSRRLAFIRRPAAIEAANFGAKRAGAPWSIRVADAETGNGREVWRADEGRGSVYRNIPAEDQLLWGANDRLVFAWEKDGWTHLYTVSAGTEAKQNRAALLTPGEFEVEHVSLAPDKREVIFSSNQGDIDRRHIWRVAVAGGQPVAITKGQGIEWSPVALSDNRGVAFLRSDARRPARAAVITNNSAPQDLAAKAIPAEFPASSLIEPQQVFFTSADGIKIHGQLFLPPHSKANKPHPAVIFFHGGSRRQMLLGWHYMRYYNNSYALNQYLASRGYAVLSVNYRSGIGYGMEFREALNYGATGASEFNDVLGAGLFMRSRTDVDPQRIGLWGGSYGGYLTALGLARASELFAAGVDFHGVHNWNLENRNFVAGFDPAKQQEMMRLAFQSSPMASVKTWRSPVLLIHGDDDRNVPFSETVQLVEALRAQKVEFEQLVFPDEIHDFLTHARWLEGYHAASDFLDRHLMK
ncbi:MAG: prolyl oligopeptidase family serine peptidase [Pyrinomonadaceae bacterium]